MTLKPINRRFVILADDPAEVVSDGIVVDNVGWRTNLDFVVVRGEGDGYGQGDRVVLDDPMCGRRIMVDGVPLKVVNKDNIIGVVE